MLRRIHKLKFCMNAPPNALPKDKKKGKCFKTSECLSYFHYKCTCGVPENQICFRIFFCYCLYINITKDLLISNDSGNPVDQNTSFDDKEMFRKSYVINVINEYSD